MDPVPSVVGSSGLAGAGREQSGGGTELPGYVQCGEARDPLRNLYGVVSWRRDGCPPKRTEATPDDDRIGRARWRRAQRPSRPLTMLQSPPTWRTIGETQLWLSEAAARTGKRAEAPGEGSAQGRAQGRGTGRAGTRRRVRRRADRRRQERCPATLAVFRHQRL